jgi:hypothetical protein
MTGLEEKTLDELKTLATTLHEQLARDPQHPRAELENIEWEIEKRSWRTPA